MNVWFFNHYAVPPWFYPLARPYNFAKNLTEKGFDVTIFAASSVHNSNKNLLDSDKQFRIENINNINYTYIKTCNYKGNGTSRIKNMFEYTFRLFSVTKQIKKPDVIMATSVHPLACVAGIIISKRYSCKCIIEIADIWPLTLVDMGKLNGKSIITKFMYKLEHWIYKKADKVIFTMEGGKDYIVDKGWSREIDLNKIKHINNGIDIEEFNYNKENEIFSDNDLNNESIFKVLYTGSMGQANALIYLVEAAKIIKEKGIKNIKFILFGDGYQREQLEDYAKLNQLENIVFKGKVDKKYIPNILSKGNLNVFTGQNISLYKYGLSLNKMFDYMASGKPSVSNIECGYDLLKKYNCGITVKGGSSESLAEGILEFYDMAEDKYNNYCINALNAANDFDFSILTDKLVGILAE